MPFATNDETYHTASKGSSYFWIYPDHFNRTIIKHICILLQVKLLSLSPKQWGTSTITSLNSNKMSPSKYWSSFLAKIIWTFWLKFPLHFPLKCHLYNKLWKVFIKTLELDTFPSSQHETYITAFKLIQSIFIIQIKIL